MSSGTGLLQKLQTFTNTAHDYIFSMMRNLAVMVGVFAAYLKTQDHLLFYLYLLLALLIMGKIAVVLSPAFHRFFFWIMSDHLLAKLIALILAQLASFVVGVGLAALIARLTNDLLEKVG